MLGGASRNHQQANGLLANPGDQSGSQEQSQASLDLVKELELLESRLNREPPHSSSPQLPSQADVVATASKTELNAAQQPADPQSSEAHADQPVGDSAPRKPEGFKSPASGVLDTNSETGAKMTSEPELRAQVGSAADLLPSPPHHQEAVADPRSPLLSGSPEERNAGHGGAKIKEQRRQHSRGQPSSLHQPRQTPAPIVDGIIDLTMTDDQVACPADAQTSKPAEQSHPLPSPPSKLAIASHKSARQQQEHDPGHIKASAVQDASLPSVPDKAQTLSIASEPHQASHHGPAANGKLHRVDAHFSGDADPSRLPDMDIGTRQANGQAEGQVALLSLSPPERFQSEIARMLKMNSSRGAPAPKHSAGVEKSRRILRRKEKGAGPSAGQITTSPHAIRRPQEPVGILQKADGSRQGDGHSHGDGRHHGRSKRQAEKSPRSPLGLGQHLQTQRSPGSRRLMIALSDDSGLADGL